MDDFASIFGVFGQLAEAVAKTSFVPAGLRGDKASVTAALLQGRELGLQPMASLQHIAVIDGKPTLSAQAMRALVLSAGHQLEIVESTSDRCVIKGKRADSKSWTEASFTILEAQKAGLTNRKNWQSYAKDMLIARATSRLCRWIFPDVLGGLAYTPEDVSDSEEVGEEPTPVISRQRAIAVADTKPEVEAKPISIEESIEEPITPLPYEDEQEEAVEAIEMVTESQLRKLMLQFKRHGLESRQQRITECIAIIGREINTSKELTKAEASKVIDHFESLLAGDLDA